MQVVVARGEVAEVEAGDLGGVFPGARGNASRIWARTFLETKAEAERRAFGFDDSPQAARPVNDEADVVGAWEQFVALGLAALGIPCPQGVGRVGEVVKGEFSGGGTNRFDGDIRF